MAESAPTAAERAAELERLSARLAVLEEENARLAAAARPRRRFSWRSLGSALLIVVAAILVPVSVVASWTRVQLVDEEAFIAAFAPLASDPLVQTAITDATVEAIESSLDLAATTDALFDGLEQLGLPSAATSALGLLREPAAQGLHSLLRSGVEGFVASDLFADVWSMALRTAHRALDAAVAQPSPDSALIVDDRGQVVLQLAPIIREVSAYLADNGFPFAASIPAIDGAIVVAQSDALVLVATIHGLATAVGTWLPILALAMLLGGILLARRRRVAVVGAGIGVALGGAAFLIATAVGAAIAVQQLAQAGLPGPAVGAVIDQVLGGMRASAADLVLVGVIAAVLALLLGSARLRSAMAGTNARLAGLFGLAAWRGAAWVRFLVRQRALVDVGLVVVALVLLWFLPVNAWGVVGIVVGALLVWWFMSILRADAARAEEPEPLGEPEPLEARKD